MVEFKDEDADISEALKNIEVFTVELMRRGVTLSGGDCPTAEDLLLCEDKEPLEKELEDDLELIDTSCRFRCRACVGTLCTSSGERFRCEFISNGFCGSVRLARLKKEERFNLI